MFFECALAQSVLGWNQSLMFSTSNQCPSLLCRHVLFGFSAVPQVFVYLLNLAKYFLWRARNDHRFRDVRPGTIPLMEVIEARAKSHLRLFFKRFKSPRRQRYFHRQWGHRCSVQWFFVLPFLIAFYLSWSPWSPFCLVSFLLVFGG